MTNYFTTVWPRVVALVYDKWRETFQVMHLQPSLSGYLPGRILTREEALTFKGGEETGLSNVANTQEA